jgi:hypothetical protein
MCANPEDWTVKGAGEWSGGGEWLVNVEDEVPECVSLSFTELCDAGVSAYKIYLPPKCAREIGDALVEFANALKD